MGTTPNTKKVKNMKAKLGNMELEGTPAEIREIYGLLVMRDKEKKEERKPKKRKTGYQIKRWSVDEENRLMEAYGIRQGAKRATWGTSKLLARVLGRSSKAVALRANQLRARHQKKGDKA